MLVHLGRIRSLPEYAIFSCTFDESLVSVINPDDLPANWRTYPAPVSLEKIGDDWARTRASAVLRVPSAVIEREANYLLNPEHADFRLVKISRGKRFELDFRLLQQ